MSSPQPRHVLGIVAAAACLLALAACGSDNEPTPQPTATGQGQVGEVTATPTGDTTGDTPTTAATTNGGGGGGGGGGGNQGPSYPGTAKDYGLAILQLIKGNDETKIVDLSGSSIYQYLQIHPEYQNADTTWNWASCTSGGTPTCYYFNKFGAYATVILDGSKLGQAHAVTAVTIETTTLSTSSPQGYLQGFLDAWRNGDTTKMHVYAVQSVIDWANTQTKPNGVGQASGKIWDCGSGKKCVDISSDFFAGAPQAPYFHFVVDATKLNAGQAQAMIGYVTGSPSDGHF